MPVAQPKVLHTASVAGIFRQATRFQAYYESQRLKSDKTLTPHGYIGYGSNNFVGVFLILDNKTKAELKWLVWGER